ncbi:MAG: hypothetical protein HPY62_07170 [Bacteroidales bacterium]|nr:hypothetical protein [Bacteroidales bacterium]
MKKLTVILFILSASITCVLKGQTDTIPAEFAVADTQDVNSTLFDTDDLLEISLKFDISYYKRKRSDIEYIDAVLQYNTSPVDSVVKNIKVKARGEMRRNYCDFPPLLLNFKMKDSVGGEFTGIDKLKLVPYCKLGNEEYVLKEYLVYKLYNVLTDLSYRVRLMRIKYINTAKDSKPLVQYGFVIEPTKLLEKRTGTKEMENIKVSQKVIKPEMMDRMAIFNYMIGNTDWSVPNMHNVVILSQPLSERPELAVIIPYDFDYSGFVNTDYAVPFETLPIKSVRERYFMGICRTEEVYRNALKEFSEKKDEFIKVINDFPYLSEKSKKQSIEYLMGFFNGLEKKSPVVYKFLTECKKF